VFGGAMSLTSVLCGYLLINTGLPIPVVILLAMDWKGRDIVIDASALFAWWLSDTGNLTKVPVAN
jgi:hypothetical protein